jgi:hypothetical protein
VVTLMWRPPCVIRDRPARSVLNSRLVLDCSEAKCDLYMTFVRIVDKYGNVDHRL